MIQRAATQPGGGAPSLDHQLAQASLLRSRPLLVIRSPRRPTTSRESGVDLSGPGAEQQDLVQPPVSADTPARLRSPPPVPTPPLVELNRRHRPRLTTGRCARRRATASAFRLQQRRRLGRRRPHGVGQQRQRRQDNPDAPEVSSTPNKPSSVAGKAFPVHRAMTQRQLI